MLCFVVSVVEALNNRVYYEGIYDVISVGPAYLVLTRYQPDNKIKEPLDRVTCMRTKYLWIRWV